MITNEDQEDQNQDDPKPRRSLHQMQIDAAINEGRSAWSCPVCGCQNWRVSNVWHSGTNRKRLRKCRNCDNPITTCELPVPDGYRLEIKKIAD